MCPADVCRTSFVHCQSAGTRLVLLLLAALAAGSANTSFAATTISVNFQGRTSTGSNPPVPGLLPTDVAGVVPATNWNNIDDAYGKTNVATFVKANVGTTTPLVDSTGA